MAMSPYPSPTGGASLMLCFRPTCRSVLIIGSNTLAACRAFLALEADAKVIIASSTPRSEACGELLWRLENSQVSQWVDLDPELDGADIAQVLDRHLDISLVCITDTLLGSHVKNRRSAISASLIRDICAKRRVPVNVTDMPSLCDFVFPSTHRFNLKSSNRPSRLQVGITTNGKGCRLSGRIKREIVSKLHPSFPEAIERVGELRDLARSDKSVLPEQMIDELERDDDAGAAPLNTPVAQLSSAVMAQQNPMEVVSRRMRWVSQVSEYWPLDRLAALDEDTMKHLLGHCLSLPSGDGGKDVTAAPSFNGVSPDPNTVKAGTQSRHEIDLHVPSPRGMIYLVGSGTGHPSMLTVAAKKCLTKLATRVLSDKLVPAEIIGLIPNHIPVYIAKKFPGNSEGAQNELMDMALEGARKGEVVVRLKQGDPMVYGRGGEEVLHFRAHGFEPIVIPGISSALAGPAFTGIPPTQRGVAETLMIGTGVGRKGKEVELPGYERSRTLVILMGVARLPQLVERLTKQAEGDSTRRANGFGAPYPGYLPIAIIERASSLDQRLVASTLDGIMSAVERVGEQRPPGMMVIGWTVLALEGRGDLSVLDDAVECKDDARLLEERDRKRVEKWLGKDVYLVKDGLGREWQELSD